MAKCIWCGSPASDEFEAHCSERCRRLDQRECLGCGEPLHDEHLSPLEREDVCSWACGNPKAARAIMGGLLEEVGS